MMTRLQVAIAVIVGYWLGRTRHTKPGMMLAAAGAGRLAGSPQEMVDHAAKLLQASPEFAALDESVRGQLLDAVRVAAVTAGTARSDVDIDVGRLLPSGSDEALQTADELVEDTAELIEDVPADESVRPVVDGAETTAANVGKGLLGAAGALKRRRPAKRRLPATDLSAHADDVDTDIDAQADDAQSDDVPTADDSSAATPEPSTADVRAWAREHGLPVSDRGRLRAEVWEAYTAAHPER
ncbi:MAG: histone-like nucleoid-structuring protein Lsr2 [Rhodococcus sp. (in: high G+C Gram-positive bacteria)]